MNTDNFVKTAENYFSQFKYSNLVNGALILSVDSIDKIIQEELNPPKHFKGFLSMIHEDWIGELFMDLGIIEPYDLNKSQDNLAAGKFVQWWFNEPEHAFYHPPAYLLLRWLCTCDFIPTGRYLIIQTDIY